ncbi:MAG: branched-chain amino acid ABC transporter substrate-binding protein [Dehalococcoidia bacterium]|nr:MAG: branched-chain amino acid ABC transporter substrate-binding protein [Dehalococcoidia bacterium]
MNMPFRFRSRAIPLGLTLLLALALVAVACGEEEEKEGEIKDIERSPDTPIVISAGEPIIVGVSAALIGPTATQGTESRDATVVGVARWKEANGDQIKGHDIEIHAADDGCFEADITELAAERLLGIEGLVGVIGPMCSDGSAAVISTYANAGVVMISGSATRTDLTLIQPEPKFFFRTAYTNAGEGALQARYVIARLDAATAYVIDDSEIYGEDLANAAQDALEESGIEVTRESIVPGAVDFSDLAGRIAGDNPDVVIFEGFNPEGALLYRQLRDAGYSGPFIGSDGTAVASDFIEPLGDDAEGAIFAGCSPTLPEEFLDDYVGIVGSEPVTAFPGQYADAATILLDAVAEVAVEQADGSLVIEPLELRDAVSMPKLLAGLSGAIAFDENGDRLAESSGLAMCEVEGGEFVNFRF